MSEKKTDILISKLLEKANIDFEPNESKIKEVNEALKTASKRGTGKKGFPEYVAQVKDFIIVIEDKKDLDKLAKYLDSENSTLLMDIPSIENYAINGAVHYGNKIASNTSFKKVFAIGCAGSEENRIKIQPAFVTDKTVKLLPQIKDFENLSDENIERYYNEKVLENRPIEQVELEDILRQAQQLHEDLRNYGQLGETEKPLVVSGILLALCYETFSTNQLTCDSSYKDGQKIFDALSHYMDKVKVEPGEKKERVLQSFQLIKNRPVLSEMNEKLGKTPLRYYAEYLDSNIFTSIRNNTKEDVLGRFYGEFISYSGGDGQSLGVVLTPKHITELFTELVDLQPDDKVFDPCCGTGGFLISAMNKMLGSAKNDSEKEKIKKNNLHGIELREDMYSIATTNMILRGDGKSNLLCADFLKKDAEELQKKEFTVGFMNPPYSQAKKKVTKELSELKFICHLLDSLSIGARCVVIVPQSTMVGSKSKEDAADKQYILDNHTLEGVITLNPETFYKVGTNPVIAVFTARKPHPKDKLCKFVNFKDDGYETFAHIGLLPTERAEMRKKLLLDCWKQGKNADNSFIVRTTVKADDEWLHSFYYFNPEIPSEEDFEKTIADYLTFEFSMIAHGKGYLFGIENE